MKSPNEVALYERLGKPLPGEGLVASLEILEEMKERVDVLKTELFQWYEKYSQRCEGRRLREAAEHGAVITRDDDEDQPVVGHEPTIKHRPASVKKED